MFKVKSISSFLFSLVCCLLTTFSGASQQINADITFVYWMPYDNNLHIWTDSVYHMIGRGLQSENYTVTIQKDMPGPGGMVRSMIQKDKISHELVNNDLSASGKSYYDYLKWVAKNINSKKYALFFLDHGGKLDEVGLDEFPEKRFLRIDSIAWAIEQFNYLTDKKVELVYLQVCTKGSIEAIYELRNACKYTMFSQAVMGAPNLYFEQFLTEISQLTNPDISGLQLSKLIARTESPQMYQSLTCIKNQHFDAFDIAFQNFITQCRYAESFSFSEQLVQLYDGETYFDLAEYFKAFGGLDQGELFHLLNKLIVMNEISPENHTMKGFCGLSLVGPGNGYPIKLKQYSHLTFFNKFDMLKVYEAMQYLRLKH